MKLKALAHTSHQQEWGASIDPQDPSLGNLGKGAFLGASSKASAEFQPMTNKLIAVGLLSSRACPGGLTPMWAIKGHTGSATEAPAQWHQL